MSKTAWIGGSALGACIFALAFQAQAQTAKPNDEAASTDIMGTWVRSDQEARFQPPP